MTVAALPASIGYTENGSTVSFGVPFRFNAPTDLYATRTSPGGTTIDLNYGVDFTATGGTTDAGGTLVVTAAAVAGTVLNISRSTPRRQSVQYTTGDRFPAVMTEQTFDIAMLIDQEQDDVIGDIKSRSFLVPVGEAAQTIPPRGSRSGKVFAWDAAGNPIAVGGAVKVPGYDQSAIRQALAAAGLLQTVRDNLPPEDTSAVRILWDTGARVQNGDALFAFIQQWTGYTLEQMNALLAAASSNTTVLPEYAASIDPNALVTFLAYLSTASGSGLMGSRRSTLPNSAALLTQQQKNDQRFDLSDMEGFDPTGATDNLAIVQIAFNEAAAAGMPLYVPAGVIALSGKVTVPQGCTVIGAGRSRGVPATRFHFTDTGANLGFICGDGLDAPQIEDGFLFRDIVVSQAQPTPPLAGTWAPNDTPALFVMNGSTDLDLEHVLFLNATRAVNMLGGGGIGRLNMDNCGGQVFIYGVNIELAADTCKFTNVHWWPFWSDTLPVNNYTCAHADHWRLARCDTPQFMNVSSIGARSEFRFLGNAFGVTTKAQISNAGLDFASYNIWFDSTCNGASAWFSNVTMGANNSAGDVANIAATNPRINVKMEGTNDYLAIQGLDLGGASGPAVWLDGFSEECHLSGGIFVHDYGTVPGNTDGCFVSNNNNRLHLHSAPRVDNPGAGKLYDGTGYISAPSWRSFTPIVSYGGSPAGQSVTTISKFKIVDKTCIVDIDVTFVTIGTGATDIRFSLPYLVNSEIGNGTGAGYSGTPLGLIARVYAGQAIVTLASNGGYPGVANGAAYHLRFEYPF